MPLKIQLLIVFFWVLGIGIGAYLLYRCYRTFTKPGTSAKFREAFFFTGFLSLVFALSYVFVPCFNPFRPVFCRGDALQPRLALSFDDGPNEPFTSQILDILQQYGVHATFFLLGENVERSPQVLERMLRDGHEIGNHTFSHETLPLKSPARIEAELQAWETAVKPLGISTGLFRAPHGWKVPWLYSVLDRKGYRLIGWTRGVWDTDQPDEELLFRRLTQNLRPGEIILMHDGIDTQLRPDRSVLVKVLPRVLRYYQEQGYQLGTVGELAASSSPAHKPL